MASNIADSILALSSKHGQHETPRKKDLLFQKRIEELDRDAKVKIAKLKILLPHGTEKEDAISLLETFNINDRYEDREKKIEKMDILIEKMWEEDDISNYEDEIARTYGKLQDIFMTIFFIKTPETQHYFDSYVESSIPKDD